MCAIAGIVKCDVRERAERSRLVRMADIQQHRGPDGAGLWLDGAVGLAHRRLAIIDVAGGHQPMTNEDDSVWIVFNGEIYNHAVLRREMQRAGHRYRTKSDTETILHLYEAYGPACVDRLQGMFAFAIWDRRQRRLLLVRDRLGIKPLYYACTDQELLFASEIKGIVASGGLKVAFNETILPEYLANRYVAGEETFYRGVSKLLPGHLLEWSAEQGCRVRRYWHPPQDSVDLDIPLSEQAGQLRAGLERAVQSHLMSDVPLGLFLSGGLDSSGLAALMAPLMPHPVKTFAVGFAEREANELQYARLVARAIGAEHHEVVVSPGQFMQALPKLIWHEDEPIAFPSSVLLYFVSRLASEDVKVVLTGEGADELFLGYDWYRVSAWNERLGRPWWRHAPEGLRARARSAVAGHRYAGRSFLALDDGPRAFHCENFAPFPEAMRGALLGGGPARDPHERWLRGLGDGDGPAVGRMGRADLETFVVELLMKQDQMSMAASIESRVPYLDHRFVERVAALPTRHKLSRLRTKAVLREAARGLVPPQILRRRKMGFPVPVNRWFRGPARPWVDDLVLGERARERGLFDPAAVGRLADEHSAGSARHGERLWLLGGLELWQRVFIDGEAAALP